MEQQYPEQWNPAMMEDYCWFLQSETENTKDFTFDEKFSAVKTNLLYLYHATDQSLTWSFVFMYGLIFLFFWMLYTQFIQVFFSPLRKIPGVTYYPFIGSLPQMLTNEIHELFEKWVICLDSSIVRYYWTFGTELLLIADANLMKLITVTHSKYFRKPDFGFNSLKQIVGNGLLVAEGEQHRVSRKLCFSSFKIKLLKGMVPVFDQCGHQLTDHWRESLKQNPDEDSMEILILEDLSKMNLDIIGKCLFSFDFNAMKNPNQDIVINFRSLLEDLHSEWMMMIPFYNWLPINHRKRFFRTLESVNNFIYLLIAERQSHLADSVDKKEYMDLLECLLLAQDEETGKKLNDTELRDQIMTFMLAGHDTTTNALSWFLLQMAQYPAIQEKVRQEVMSVLPQDDQPITYNHLEKLSYLTCAIKETLRLYAPISLNVREALQDKELDGYFIPKGTKVILGIGAMHRNPKYWKDPLEFKPERFQDESLIHPYAYLPFFAGSHKCIGHRFAMIKLKTLAALFLRNFRFRLVPGIIYKRQLKIAIRTDPPLVLRISEVASCSL